MQFEVSRLGTAFLRLPKPVRSRVVRSPAARAAIVIAALLAVVVLFVVLGASDDEGGSGTTDVTTEPTGTNRAGRDQSTPPRPTIRRIVVRNAKPVGGVGRLTYEKGDRVRFEVSSDVSDEVHVHGYDVSKALPAGGTARFSFPASIEGVFEVELEQRGEPIAELRVNPR